MTLTLGEWKDMAVTQEFMAELTRRKDELIEQLADSAGVDPRLDAYRAGVIAALKDVVDFHFEEASA